MGGKIDFDSQPNVWTTFFVEFPVWNQTPAVASKVLATNNKMRVLICEDDKDIARLLSLMLNKAGFASDIASDATQAKEMLFHGEYAAMTLDLGLPDQDGVSLIRKLRTTQKTANLPIIVVSASADKGHQELQGESYRMIEWINKPIHEDRLVTALEQAISRLSSARPRVLHVEDDQDIFRVLQTIAGKFADMDNASTLADARCKLKENHYDLAILDITLPDGSGMDLLQDLNGATPPVPVMVFSSSEISMDAFKQVGASLVKSRTDNTQLLATIKRMVAGE
jgi:DNA-binding response OmpR family regulator